MRLNVDKEDIYIILESLSTRAYYDPFNQSDKKRAMEIRARLRTKLGLVTPAPNPHN